MNAVKYSKTNQNKMHKLKVVVLIFCLSFTLVGCERIASMIFSKLNFSDIESTAAQDLKAHQIYTAFKNYDETTVNSLLAESLVKELQGNKTGITDLFSLIPAEDATEMYIASVNKSVQLPNIPYTSVDYLYTYLSCTVNFRVTFTGHEGSDEVIGIYITQNKQKSEQCVSGFEASKQKLVASS